VQLCEQLDVEDEDSIFSAEGTVAHLVRELCLSQGLDPADFVGQEIVEAGFKIAVTDDMAEALTPGIEWLREQPGKLFVEQRVSGDRWLPGQFGTLDAGVVGKKRHVVNDLKYGAGTPVSVVDNEQIMIYALFFWDTIARHESKATDFLLVVDQPRARGSSRVHPPDDWDGGDEDSEAEADEDDQNVGGWGGEWHVTLDELLAFGERIKSGIDLASDPRAWLRAGHVQCRMCPAKGRCDEFARWSLDLLKLEFADLDPGVIVLPKHGEFTPAHRVKIAMNQDVIKTWLRSVYAQVIRDAQAERDAPGVKAVIGQQGPRKWRDEKEAEKMLRRHLQDDIYGERKLLSPAQTEKKIPKDSRAEIADLVVRSPGKPTLVWEGDDRPAIKIADEFDDDEANADLDDEFDDEDEDDSVESLLA